MRRHAVANSSQDGTRVCLPRPSLGLLRRAAHPGRTPRLRTAHRRRRRADRLTSARPGGPHLGAPGGARRQRGLADRLAPGTGTGWHDHAESVGAFITAAGELKENSLAARLPADGWKTLELSDDVDRERRLPAYKGRSFGQHHVHEVLNESTEAHAISVHAYYPPLPQIRRYSRTAQILRLEHVERPEDWQ